MVVSFKSIIVLLILIQCDMLRVTKDCKSIHFHSIISVEATDWSRFELIAREIYLPSVELAMKTFTLII